MGMMQPTLWVMVMPLLGWALSAVVALGLDRLMPRRRPRK
ncbi:hypothetical protein Fbal_3294 [Ferrimonas balearica DSM 9799]|uniref:Uncharacterized protein n=1 Tax=Ferrimonas balearica (strain DSM 9799 / CCM 4581 / KCTC 23876 / PAT) TaxID=550540 RepID=E1SWN1_FERBD|nr:hypothetical protein Fbal_3294 [Ferrimonas balearica DSM 9799]